MPLTPVWHPNKSLDRLWRWPAVRQSRYVTHTCLQLKTATLIQTPTLEQLLEAGAMAARVTAQHTCCRCTGNRVRRAPAQPLPLATLCLVRPVKQAAPLTPETKQGRYRSRQQAARSAVCSSKPKVQIMQKLGAPHSRAHPIYTPLLREILVCSGTTTNNGLQQRAPKSCGRLTRQKHALVPAGIVSGVLSLVAKDTPLQQLQLLLALSLRQKGVQERCMQLCSVLMHCGATARSPKQCRCRGEQ